MKMTLATRRKLVRFFDLMLIVGGIAIGVKIILGLLGSPAYEPFRTLQIPLLLIVGASWGAGSHLKKKL